MASVQDFRRPEIDAGEKPALELQPKPEQRKGFRISFFFRFRFKATKPRRVRLEGGALRTIHALEAHQERSLEASVQDDKEEYTFGGGAQLGVDTSVTPPEPSDPLG